MCCSAHKKMSDEFPRSFVVDLWGQPYLIPHPMPGLISTLSDPESKMPLVTVVESKLESSPHWRRLITLEPAAFAFFEKCAGFSSISLPNIWGGCGCQALDSTVAWRLSRIVFTICRGRRYIYLYFFVRLSWCVFQKLLVVVVSSIHVFGPVLK